MGRFCVYFVVKVLLFSCNVRLQGTAVRNKKKLQKMCQYSEKKKSVQLKKWALGHKRMPSEYSPTIIPLQWGQALMLLSYWQVQHNFFRWGICKKVTALCNNDVTS
jgi:hypothetical protein